MEVAEVSLISAEEFAALSAAPEIAPEGVPEPEAVPETPAEPEPVAEPEPEPAPEPAPAEQPAPTPQPETQPAPEAESQAADTPSQAQIDAAARQEAGLLPGPVAKVLLENRLAQLGYDPGRKDGVVDQNTRNALKSYQADQDIPATGYVDNATAARLLTQ